MDSLPSYSDAELLQQLKRGSKPAFEELYNRLFPSVYHFAQRVVTNNQAAEDLTTETFLKLWSRAENFESLPAIKSFLQVTVKNACFNFLRTKKREASRHVLYETGAHDPDAITRGEVSSLVWQQIFDEIEKLPEQEKKVIRMAYLEGLSNEEIAGVLSINNQSVRNHKSRALKTLRLVLLHKDMLESFLLFCVL